MRTKIIIHSILVNGDDLVHSMQVDNRARMDQIRLLMFEEGYDIREDVAFTNEGYYSIMFFCLEDRHYTHVPKRTHTAILKILKIPIRSIDHHTKNVISTYTTVRHSKNMNVRRPTSPVTFSLR